MNFDGTSKALCGNCSGVTEYGLRVKCGHCGNPLSEKSVAAFREQEYRHRTECDDQKSSESGASEEDEQDAKTAFVRSNTKQGQNISMADMKARYEDKP